MANISVYLTFNGNCREAMVFYKDCLGGVLTIQTVGSSPLSNQLPKCMQNLVLHSMLTNNELVLMATDMACENGLQKGNNVSLMLNCNSEEQMYECFKKLSAEGRQNQPIAATRNGALMGDLTDKFGNQWVLNFQLNNP